MNLLLLAKVVIVAFCDFFSFFCNMRNINLIIIYSSYHRYFFVTYDMFAMLI